MGLQDDVIYLGLLVVSIGWGWVCRTRTDPTARKWLSTTFGLFVLFTVSGVHGLHCVLSFLLQAALLFLCPAGIPVHLVSLGVQFTYLFFFRLGYLLGVPSPPPHTNAIQMILALKLIGVAFEVVDTRRNRKAMNENPEDESLKLEDDFRGVDPSFLDLFHYSFNHAGILTGPYYKFRTFNDLHAQPYSAKADCDWNMLARLVRAPFYIGLFMLSGWLFPLKAVEAEGFYEETSFLWRLFYMTPVFFNFRMRLYTGFVLSECSCIMAGIGAYPKKFRAKPGQGPSKLDSTEDDPTEPHGYDFEAVHNIDEYSTDFVATMREALRGWNMTVQYWLVFVVYRRLPASKGVRTTVVMIVSSMWHGVYSGYYLSLVSVPLVLVVEDLYAKIMRRRLSDKGQRLYDWVSWFMRMQWFSYLGMGFQLLRSDATLTFWTSIWFVGHLVLPVFYVAGLVIVKPLMKSIYPDEEQEKKSQ